MRLDLIGWIIDVTNCKCFSSTFPRVLRQSAENETFSPAHKLDTRGPQYRSPVGHPLTGPTLVLHRPGRPSQPASQAPTGPADFTLKTPTIAMVTEIAGPTKN
ncbi:unnamed protein product [Protopolystoma xenopodis]|uniref:Uncharacterized protein n=1 Tax=Protopolystoma xenopodis TaxID=117903 RepID=A0A448WP51_9PLAT|nr:unnamed protein product [Protopolystoma xenopodis]